MNATPQDATDPTRSASVRASAGTGKTWLLVTRTVRLLLAGAAPGGILAVTFTNRAAGEMLARLRDRCAEFARAPDDALGQALIDIGASDDAETRARARGLYHALLTAPFPPRVVTFHAFCQDLLSRFPIEAGVPPGFELLANERELLDAAWDALLAECARGGEVADALAWLAERAGSLDGARRWLRHFMQQRADWWAWTEGQDALPFALEATRDATGFAGEGADELFAPARRDALARLCKLVGTAPSAAIRQPLDAVATLLADAATDADALCAALPELLLTKSGDPRKALANKAAMAEHGDEITTLHRALVTDAADWALAALNRRWFIAGHALLGHYQRLKAETRVLDFADLEWRACRLLTSGDLAPWIQYRLDQRIDHLLVDEFQDTSPTQWRMVQPLLDEIAAGDAGRPRSAFIVGDEKQSIYGFRRADPRLLAAAATMLDEQLRAAPVELVGSRRSAAAVMAFVNAVFGLDHPTHRADAPGWVEWLAVDDDAAATPPPRDGLRDPLTEPRKPDVAVAGLAEARAIAARILALGVPWDDVMVLVRKRTRLPALERALREAGIPYASDSRGMLLERPEVGDLMALLEFLAAPWHNLQLARLLKSPLFGCTDEALLLFAPDDPDRPSRIDWYTRLQDLAQGPTPPAALARAARLLASWRALADTVPVHDLLDQIFADADVLARYSAAAPAHLRASVRANLIEFLRLALDADAGRYPTLHRLVERLERTRDADAHEREFDDATVESGEGRVRVMTIHAAKGLEARVVFVAQTDLDAGRGDGVRAWVDWPPTAVRPNLILFGPGRGHDGALAPLRARAAELEATESRNLLYVALTRAREGLIVSGSGADAGWYPELRAVFEAREFAPFVSGPPFAVDPPAVSAPPKLDPALGRPLTTLPTPVAPRAPLDPAAVEYGVLVHAALERPDRAALTRLSGRRADDPLLSRAFDAAARIRAHADFGWLFSAPRAWNEARLTSGDAYGIVDRLVVTEDEVWIVDYKTDRTAVVREEYRAQLARYATLARALWPSHRVRTALLFIGQARLEEVES